MAEKYCSPVFKCGEDLDKALAAALCSCDDAARAEAAAKAAQEAAGEAGSMADRVSALEQLVDDKGKIKTEALPDDVGGNDPRVDDLLEVVGDMIDEDSGKINPEYLPKMEVTDPRVDDLVTDVNDINAILRNIGSMFDTEGRLLPSVLPEEKTPISIDLSDFASNGTIIERYADDSTFTTTVEFDGNGNPIKITDGNGNVTVITW